MCLSRVSRGQHTQEIVVYSEINRIKSQTELCRKILLVFQTCSMGLVFAGVALSLELATPVVVIFMFVGLSVIPLIQRINQRALSSIPVAQMSRKEALSLLNIPTERANDTAFIETQYKTAKERVTPRMPLGGPMKVQVDALLIEIDKAYAVLIAPASTT